MIKRPFFGLAKPKIEYDLSGAESAPTEVAFPARVTFLAEAPYEKKDALQMKVGDAVNAGQKLVPLKDSSAYVIAAVGGAVSGLTSYTGNFGRKYTAITIETDPGAKTDGGFNAAPEPSLAAVKDFLQFIPGGLPEGLWAEDNQIKTIVVCGVDEDLLCMTRSSVINNDADALRKGVDILKKISGRSTIVVAAPETMTAAARAIGVMVKTVGPAYPSANPFLIARDCLGETIPAGSTFAAAGVCFISAEAVAALGNAFDSGAIPARKIITVVGPNGQKKMASAVLGTPVGEVLSACDIRINERDRLVFGGPMTGTAVYSEAYPVCADTDMILVQGADQLPAVSDAACINCGECVRMCPANIPVNLLIRYLEAGEYSDAVDTCDLLSCVECGLCSFVCPAHIPVFQYITLGKFEFARQNTAEADNA